jgi:hypothetical protein
VDKEKLDSLQFDLNAATHHTQRAKRKASLIPDQALQEKVKRAVEAVIEVNLHVLNRREGK